MTAHDGGGKCRHCGRSEPHENVCVYEPEQPASGVDLERFLRDAAAAERAGGTLTGFAGMLESAAQELARLRGQCGDWKDLDDSRIRELQQTRQRIGELEERTILAGDREQIATLNARIEWLEGLLDESCQLRDEHRERAERLEGDNKRLVAEREWFANASDDERVAADSDAPRRSGIGHLGHREDYCPLCRAAGERDE